MRYAGYAYSCQLPTCILFFDLKAAYHSLVRELVLGADLSNGRVTKEVLKQQLLPRKNFDCQCGAHFRSEKALRMHRVHAHAERAYDFEPSSLRCLLEILLVLEQSTGTPPLHVSTRSAQQML